MRSEDVAGAGRALFVIALGGMGLLSLVYGDFALRWQPFPAAVPARELIARISGLAMVASAIRIFFQRSAPVASTVLCGYQLVWVLLRSLSGRARAVDGVGVARVLFGLCCISFGLSHLAYADFTAQMIPAWLPGRLWLDYLTGAGHLAAGIALLLAVIPRTAAIFEAAMMSSFVILVHLPSLFSAPPPDWAPTSRVQWTALCMSAALAGSAWLIVGALPRRR